MKKGSHQSEESKKKISNRMIEVRKTINPMKGRTGEKHQNFGKQWNEETKQKMSDGHKGQESGFKGKTHSEEAKRKNSDAHKGRVPWNKGKETGPHTKEHNFNISKGIIKHPVGNGQWYTCLTGESIWLRSSYEVRIAKVLDKLNIKWSYESRWFELGNHYYIPDFLIEDSIWWEVKGYMNDISKEKLTKFSEIYPKEKLRIIYLSDIEKLEYFSNNNIKFNAYDQGISIREI